MRRVIWRLIYASENTLPEAGLEDALETIVAASQRNNQRDGVTGFLLAEPRWFLQILEGPRDKVQATYERIRGDSRHARVTMMEAKAAEERSFARWSMAASLRRTAVEAIYRRHGISGMLKPTALRSSQVLALARDLSEA
jgi:hypothetical protein